MTYDHTENKRLYCEDWIETDTPWERWEYYWGGQWRKNQIGHLVFDPCLEYRRIPQTKTITIEVSDQRRPLVVEPSVGADVYLSDPCASDFYHTIEYVGTLAQIRALDRFQLHATAVSAEIEGRAMAELARKMAEESQK